MLRILGEDKVMVEQLRPDLLAKEFSVRADLPQVAFRWVTAAQLPSGGGQHAAAHSSTEHTDLRFQSHGLGTRSYSAQRHQELMWLEQLMRLQGAAQSIEPPSLHSKFPMSWNSFAGLLPHHPGLPPHLRPAASPLRPSA